MIDHTTELVHSRDFAGDIKVLDHCAVQMGDECSRRPANESRGTLWLAFCLLVPSFDSIRRSVHGWNATEKVSPGPASW